MIKCSTISCMAICEVLKGDKMKDHGNGIVRVKDEILVATRYLLLFDKKCKFSVAANKLKLPKTLYKNIV